MVLIDIFISNFVQKKLKHVEPPASSCYRPQCAHRGPTEGACSMAVPAMSTKPRISALRMPSTHPANHR